MKSLSSSRREVLVDSFHVYTYHIGYLLPGGAVLQHPMCPIDYLRCHYPPTSADTPLLTRCSQASAGPLRYQFCPSHELASIRSSMVAVRMFSIFFNAGYGN